MLERRNSDAAWMEVASFMLALQLSEKEELELGFDKAITVPFL